MSGSEKYGPKTYLDDINTALMNAPSEYTPEKDDAVVFDISPQLEEELLRRAREKGATLESEAAEILERHVDEESAD